MNELETLGKLVETEPEAEAVVAPEFDQQKLNKYYSLNVLMVSSKAKK